MSNKFLTGLFFIVTVAAQGQLNSGGTPWSFNLDTPQPLPVDLVLAAPDLDAVAAEDLLYPVPFRFAINLPVNAGISPQLAVGSGQMAMTASGFSPFSLPEPKPSRFISTGLTYPLEAVFTSTTEKGPTCLEHLLI